MATTVGSSDLQVLVWIQVQTWKLVARRDRSETMGTYYDYQMPVQMITTII